MLKKIIISGATGFIGQAVTFFLLKEGYEIIGLSRNPEHYQTLFQDKVKLISWDAKSSKGWWELAEGSLAFINLAGENIGSGIWTRKKRERMIESRIDAGRAMTEAFVRIKEKPKIFVQASAIGYYGNGSDQVLTENSERGQGFLADLTQQWESSISGIDRSAVRVVIFRIGLVLGRNGGILSKMSLPFRLYFGGHFGNGQQWMSWIHLQDVAGALKFALETDSIKGIINIVSPEPSRARLFFNKLGRVLHRPSWFHMPGGILQVLPGEMAQETLLISQRVAPKKLQASGYQFKFPDLGSAFSDILS
ncbi:MAG: TIGR01777 family oxidoreductase [Calditrichia bacterium]|nr:TIGR01777 family oxidoreductase [Calditrichia bacterium]